MLVNRIMRKPVIIIAPDMSVRAAAAVMANLNVGALPVCDNGHPVGFLTDRDIVVRWATKSAANGPVALIMSPGVTTCRCDQTIEQAAYLMADLQIRRLLVLDAANEITGILTLGDIANDASEVLAGQTLGEIVETR